MEGTMAPFTVPRRLTLVAASALAVAALLLAGCSKDQVSPLSPSSGADAGAKIGGVDFTLANPAVRAVAAVQDRHTPDLMGIAGVVGTATSLDANGDLAIMVLTERPLGAGRLPA